MSEIPEILCESCRQPTVRKCGVCRLNYCSGCEVQSHWEGCKSCEVCYLSGSGFVVKALRELWPGEIIFSESPLVLVPKYPVNEEGKVPCVGCNRPILEENCLKCPECLWPVCALECEHLNTQHQLECKILKLGKSTSSEIFRFDILLPLRIICLQKTNKIEWEKLLKQLEEDDSNKNSTNNNTLEIADDSIEFLEQNYLIPLKKYEEESGATLFEQDSKDFLRKVLSNLKPFDCDDVEVFYLTASLTEHSCTSNTIYIIEQHKLTMKATTHISKDTNLTCSFTNLLVGTHNRLDDLKTKNTSCRCYRCKDPTEFRTFFSALKCLGTKEKPCGGTQLPADPLHHNTVWICDMCRIELPNDQVVKFVKHLGKQVAKILSKEYTVKDLEDLLHKLLMFLHPNHFYVYSVKHALVQMSDTSEEFLLKKIQMSEDLIEIGRKLQLGGLHLAELLHQLFDCKFLLLTRSENVSGREEEIRKLSELFEENKKLVQSVPKLRQSVSEDGSKLDALLKQNSLS